MRVLRAGYLGVAALLSLTGGALAQSSPGLIRGQVPTAAQWNSYFSAKNDVLGYTPVNKAGDSMQGLLNTLASATGSAGLNLGQGAAPTSPNNGDIWITSSGVFVRAGGNTVGPLSAGTSALAGGSAGQIQFNSAGNLGGFTMSGDCTTITSTGVITCTKTGGTTFGALALLGVGTGLVSSGGNLSLNTPVSAANGGTGVNNGSFSISLSQAFGTGGTGGLTLTTTGATNATVPVGTHTLAALDLADQTVSGGANVTVLNLGTQSSGSLTPDCGARPIQQVTNGGAFTLNAPTTPGSCILLVANNGSAGTITINHGGGQYYNCTNCGDALDTVNGHNFAIFIWSGTSSGGSFYRVSAGF